MKYNFKKMAFSVGEAKSAIENPRNILAAFRWGQTVQGHFFWDEVYINGHSKESLEILNDMISKYEATK